MSLKSYPDMKPSGIAWLGTIPEHWEVLRLKTATLSVRNGIWGDEPTGNDDTICVRVADFNRKDFTIDINEPTLRHIRPKERIGRTLRQWDLLLEKSGGGESQPVGIVVIYQHDLPAVCSNFVAKIEVDPQASSRFLCYIFSFLYAIKVNTRSIKQTTGIQNLDSDAYLNEKVGFPLFAEQRNIAAYLDCKTAQIDAVVSEKEEQIRLLTEQRQAVISHAVTRGLDPNVPLKPSGIDWLGEIPTDWTIIRPRFLCGKIGSGKTPKGGSEVYSDSGIIFLRSQNIHNDGLRLDDVVYISPEVDEEMAQTRVLPNDVLLNITGASIGRTCIVPMGFPAANVNQHVCVLRVHRRLTAQFVSYSLKSHFVRMQISALENGSSREGLNFEQIGNLLIASPLDQAEQMAIVNYLDSETSRLDGIMQTLTGQILELREYRQALVSAVVTGKVDVREATR